MTLSDRLRSRLGPKAAVLVRTRQCPSAAATGEEGKRKTLPSGLSQWPRRMVKRAAAAANLSRPAGAHAGEGVPAADPHIVSGRVLTDQDHDSEYRDELDLAALIERGYVRARFGDESVLLTRELAAQIKEFTKGQW
jgi:hypothetical protein